MNLTPQELRALHRVIELAWAHVESQPPDGQRDHSSKDQRSVWAAGRALHKIKQHMKEQKHG